MPLWSRDGTRKSRAPSGVGLKRMGVSMSRKPAPSMTRRMIETICARRRRFRWSLSRRRSSQRYRMRRVSSTFSSSSWNGSGGLVEITSSSSTWSSTSPVGMFGFTFSGERAVTSPVARRTNSLRMSWAALAASGERSGLTTSWPTPVESRRSTNTSPPWSRRRATQPASVRRSPTRSRFSSPAPRSRQLTATPLPLRATGTRRPSPAGGAASRRRSARSRSPLHRRARPV